MFKSAIVSAYYDGQDRSTTPVFCKTHAEIKALRKAGLDGWYQENGKVFVLYRPLEAIPVADREKLIAAGSMSDAWVQMKSGHYGPMVLQMPWFESATA